MFTKTIHGTIALISGKTAAKMTGYGAYVGIPGLAVTVTERYEMSTLLLCMRSAWVGE